MRVAVDPVDLRADAGEEVAEGGVAINVSIKTAV